MPVQSTLRNSASASVGGTRGHSSGHHDTTNKENEPVHRSSHRGEAVSSYARQQSKVRGKPSHSDAEDDDEADDTYTPSEVNAYNHDDSDHEHAAAFSDGLSDDESPVRGRARRPSAKEAQRLAEEAEKEARKREKVVKAARIAKKKAGETEPDERGPMNDDFFTSRTVPTRLTTTKVLTQRNNRVPPPPRRLTDNEDAPSSTHRHRDSDDHARRALDNNRRERRARSKTRSPVEPRLTFRGRSPLPETVSVRAPIRNINGGIVADHVTVHLPAPTPHNFDRPRSESPSIGDKRSHSRSSDDLRTVQSPRTSTSSARPKAKDYDERTQEYLAIAIDYYRCLLTAEQPFPDHLQEATMVRRSWDHAGDQIGEQLRLTPAMYKLIANRGPHLRGELKTKAKAMAEVIYKFKSGNNKKIITYNRQLAEHLKEGSTFAFKDIEEKKGLFKHEILQKIANVMWFANRRDEGPKHPELFNPFPVSGLALILTVVENTIDEFSTGIKTDVPFTANEYRSVYEGHLASLEEFRAHTAKYQILEKILVRLHDIGRFHSGAQPLAAVVKPKLNKGVLDAALKEYEEDSATDSDEENEDQPYGIPGRTVPAADD